MELVDRMQPLDDPPLLLDMDNNSGLTVSFWSNDVDPIADLIEAPCIPLEGNFNLNISPQAQQIPLGLPGLNLVLGSLQAHQHIAFAEHVVPLQANANEGPQQIDLGFVPLVPPADHLPAPPSYDLVRFDLNQAQPELIISQEVWDNDLVIDHTVLEKVASNETDKDPLEALQEEIAPEDFSEDPVIQLADPSEPQVNIMHDPEYSTFVDEEIEINKLDMEVTSLPLQATSDVMLMAPSNDASSSSESSAPSGFNIKGKFLVANQDISPPRDVLKITI